jgi:transposase
MVPTTTPIPVLLSGPEFIAFIFPHLSMSVRGPKFKLGYHRIFNLILWVLYTGMQWKWMPVPTASDGTALIHYTTIYKVFAKWADDGSLDQAFIASVRHLAEQHHLDLTILHGDGTNTVAKKGGDGIGYSGPQTSDGREDHRDRGQQRLRAGTASCRARQRSGYRTPVRGIVVSSAWQD